MWPSFFVRATHCSVTISRIYAVGESPYLTPNEGPGSSQRAWRPSSEAAITPQSLPSLKTLQYVYPCWANSIFRLLRPEFGWRENIQLLSVAVRLRGHPFGSAVRPPCLFGANDCRWNGVRVGTRECEPYRTRPCGIGVRIQTMQRERHLLLNLTWIPSLASAKWAPRHANVLQPRRRSAGPPFAKSLESRSQCRVDVRPLLPHRALRKQIAARAVPASPPPFDPFF